MRNAVAIAAKDLRVYLTTWTSYILFGAFTFITAFFFYQLVKEFQLQLLELSQSRMQAALEQMNLTDWVMGPVFVNAGVFLLFLVPVLSMRLVAEERRGRTLELLMTTPVRPAEIVLGKYLAALVILAIMLILTMVFPMLLHVVGESADTSPLDWNTIWVSYLGLYLFGAACIAVGLFASSLTESQIVAAIVSFAVLLLFWVIGLAARGQEGFMRQLLEYLSLTGHLESFVRGILKLSDVVYYLSLAFVGLFLAYRVVEAQRWR
jgi:ABC-2 type transport system permease protein